MPKSGSRGGGNFSANRPFVIRQPPLRNVEDYPGWSKFTDIQKQAVRAANERKSVIVCGAAGTGKSFMIKALDWLGAAITATTGTAACILPHGSTIHHRLGWRVGETVAEWVARGEHKQFAGKLQRYGGRFVIDEVSMLGDDSATLISEMFCAAVPVIPARICKNLGLDASRPFGGCTMIFCGDMMQLLPVGDESRMFYHSQPVQEIFWPDSIVIQPPIRRVKTTADAVGALHAFLTVMAGGRVEPRAEPPPVTTPRQLPPTGHAPTGICVMLVQIFRQTSPLYRHLVECVRYAVMTPLAWLLVAIITQRADLLKSSSATQLFPTNCEVDRVNSQQLRQFENHFETRYYWTSEERRGRILKAGDRLSDKDARVVKYIKYHGNKDPNPRRNLVLAVGARIIFTHNLAEGDEGPAVTNGEHGRITSVTDPDGMPVIKVFLDNGGERMVNETKLAERKIVLTNDVVVVDELYGYPLALGWAKTIHRAQGIGVNALIVDLSASSIYGLQSGALYTALSRCGAMTHIAPKGLFGAVLKHKWTRELQHFCGRMGFNPMTERTRLLAESKEMMPNITTLLFEFERIVKDARDIINLAVYTRDEINRLRGPGNDVYAAIMCEFTP